MMFFCKRFHLFTQIFSVLGIVHGYVDGDAFKTSTSVDGWADDWLKNVILQKKDSLMTKDSFRIGPYRLLKKYCATDEENKLCLDVNMHIDEVESFPVRIHMHTVDNIHSPHKRIRRDVTSNKDEDEESDNYEVDESGNDTEINEIEEDEAVQDEKTRIIRKSDNALEDNDEDEYYYYEDEEGEYEDENNEIEHGTEGPSFRSFANNTAKDTPDWARCRLPPPLATAEVYCKNTPGQIACHIFCVHGHSYPEGVSRKTSCALDQGVWTKKIEDCKPFVDCTLKLRSAGFLKCHSHAVNRAPECEVSCERFAVHAATPVKTYVCTTTGRWTPTLPHCVSNEGIELIEAPSEREVKQIHYPK